MGKDKLRKFAEINLLENVYQMEEGKALRGQWCVQHFKNKQPLVVELACGKGEYTVNMGVLFPDKNFIGVDLKGNRIWRGARTATDENIVNVAFLRIQIEDIVEYFAPLEVDEIWIAFPDPQPQLSREKKRLTALPFLKKYKKILKPGGFVNLKTDNDQLYAYTKDLALQLGLTVDRDTTDLYHSDLADEVLSIKTYYEKKYLKDDKNINYIRFTLDALAE